VQRAPVDRRSGGLQQRRGLHGCSGEASFMIGTGASPVMGEGTR
jgi:hypothetical protein